MYVLLCLSLCFGTQPTVHRGTATQIFTKKKDILDTIQTETKLYDESHTDDRRHAGTTLPTLVRLNAITYVAENGRRRH